MEINFEKSIDGFVPAIVQDAQTGKVLMLGYMNAEAFEKTQNEKRITFFSRSRQRLWTKGERSGNFLSVEEILPDCDRDALLIKATPAGAICHTGADTCFAEENRTENFLLELEKTIWQRKFEPREDSYTTGLFAEGIKRISQKVGEEAVELVIEANGNDKESFENEAADLLYHLLVLLAAKDSRLEKIVRVLRNRKK